MANKTLEMAIALKGKLDSSLGGAVRAATNQLRAMSSDIRNLNSQANLLNRQFQNGAISANEFASRMAELSGRLQEVQGRQEHVTQLVDNYGNSMDKLGSRAKAFGMAAGAMVAITAPLVAATNEAIKFESVMADVRKVVDFENEGQFKEMSNDILELSQNLPMAAEGIAEIVAAGGQSGIAREDLMQFAEAATKMGTAFDITADQAGNMMAKWRTAFKMGQDDVVDLADKINYLGNTTAASAPMISDVVTRIGPLGEIGGVASGEIAALGASMVGTGVQSDVAATGIKNLILGMTAGEGATKSQAAAFAQLGMDATTMAQRMQTDAKGAILDVMKSLQGLDKYQQSAVLANLFGKESIGAISPLLSNLDALEENFNKVADASQYAGSMEAEYAARSKTVENQIQLAKNALRAVVLNIGNALLPALGELIGMIAPLIRGVANWTAQNQGLVKVILALAFAIGAVITIGLGIATISAAWQALGAAMALSAATGEGSIAVMTLLGIRTRISAAATMLHARANAIFGASMTALRNPLTTVTSLIGGIPGRLSAFRAAIMGIPAMISGAFTAIPGIISGAFAGLATVGLPVILAIVAIIAVVALVAANFDKLKETASIVFNHISGTVSAMVATVKAKFDEAVSKTVEVWNSVTGQALSSSEYIGAIFNNLGFIIGAAFDVAAGIVGTAISVVLNLIASAAQIIGGVVNIVVGLFTGDWKRAWDGAGQAVEGFAGGTIGTLKTVVSGIGDIFDTLMGKADEVESRAKTAIAASPVVDNQAAIAAAQQMSTATADASANAQTLAANTQQAGVEAQQASGYMEQLQGVMQNLPAASQGAFDGIGTASSNAAQAVQTNLQQIPENTQAVFQQLPPMAQQGTDGIATEFGQLAAKCQPGGEAFVQGANTWGQQAYQNIANWADQMAAVVVDRLSSAWSQISAQFSAGLNVNVTTTSSAVPHAEGGIFSSPHLGLVAEAGVPEAVIPLDRSQRSMGLYNEAGKALGIPSVSSGGSGSASVTFAPVVTINGNASGEDVRNALQTERERFEAWYRDMQSRNRRLSFA